MNTARLIADIFVPTVNIGGRGQGGGRAERGERPRGPKGGRGRSAGEGGRNGDRTGRPRGKSETGTRTKAVRRTTTGQVCGGRGL